MEKKKLATWYYNDANGASITVKVFATEDEEMYHVVVDRLAVNSSNIVILDEFDLRAKDIDGLIEQYDKEYNQQ